MPAEPMREKLMIVLMEIALGVAHTTTQLKLSVRQNTTLVKLIKWEAQPTQWVVRKSQHEKKYQSKSVV